jgi:hypothetical protein
VLDQRWCSPSSSLWPERWLRGRQEGKSHPGRQSRSAYPHSDRAHGSPVAYRVSGPDCVRHYRMCLDPWLAGRSPNAGLEGPRSFACRSNCRSCEIDGREQVEGWWLGLRKSWLMEIERGSNVVSGRKGRLKSDCRARASRGLKGGRHARSGQTRLEEPFRIVEEPLRELRVWSRHYGDRRRAHLHGSRRVAGSPRTGCAMCCLSSY